MIYKDFEDFFDGTLEDWYTDSFNIKLKTD